MLLKLRNRGYPTLDGKISFPQSLATVDISYKTTAKVYTNNANIKMEPIDWLSERAILTPKNDTAAAINYLLLKSFEGDKVQYKSVDSVLQTDDAVNYPAEFLNTLNSVGFPPQNLILEIGASVMLLINLRISSLSKYCRNHSNHWMCSRGNCIHTANTVDTLRLPISIQKTAVPPQSLLRNDD